MTVAPRKRIEIVARRKQVAEKYLRGMYMAQIADELGVDTATISRDLAELRKEWLDRSVNHIDQKKAIELAKLDRLEVTYWEAWERSCLNVEVEITEQIGVRTKEKTIDGKPQEIAIQPERIKKSKRVEGQSGNPAFLEGVLKCINKRCEIIGLNAPTKAVTLDLSQLSDEQLERIAKGEDVYRILADTGSSRN